MAAAGAISPFLLGQMSDSLGIETTIWICVGVSFCAALINVPLIFVKSLKRPAKLEPDYTRPLQGEDDDIIEKALRGEWVPARYLNEINQTRMNEGKRFLVLPYKPYKEDKENLAIIQKQARSDFQDHKDTLKKMLLELNNDDSNEEKKKELIEKFEKSRPPEETREELKQSLGEWFTDYIVGSGYTIEDSPIMFKQMIIRAFPPLFDDDTSYDGDEPKVTVQNLQQCLVNSSKIVHRYLDEDQPTLYNQAFANRFGRGGGVVTSSLRRRHQAGGTKEGKSNPSIDAEGIE